jgi:DNA-directed RNA polymerase specialized sigma24 family protein
MLAGFAVPSAIVEDSPKVADGKSPEEVLLEGAKSGDKTCFEGLMIRHQQQVLRTALQFLGNSDEARDAAQEVFLRLYRYIHTVEAGRSLPAWLYRVTVNVCKDLERRRRRVFEVSLDQQAAGGFNPAGDDDVMWSIRGFHW